MGGKRRAHPSGNAQGMQPSGLTRVGPSDDTLQRVLPLLLEHLGPEVAWPCLQTCRAWRRELEARGICRRTLQMCSNLAHDGRLEQLGQKAMKRVRARSESDNPALCIDANAFLQNSWGWSGSLHEWLQAASQEPDASFLSRGAASTAECLGLTLVQWPGKPAVRYPGECTRPRHPGGVLSVAFSGDGKRIVSGSRDKQRGGGGMKIWDLVKGAEVSPFGDKENGLSNRTMALIEFTKSPVQPSPYSHEQIGTHFRLDQTCSRIILIAL